MCFSREWLLPVDARTDALFSYGALRFVNIANVGKGGCGYSAIAEALIEGEVCIPFEYQFPGEDHLDLYIPWTIRMAGTDPCSGRNGYTHTHTYTTHYTHAELSAGLSPAALPWVCARSNSTSHPSDGDARWPRHPKRGPGGRPSACSRRTSPPRASTWARWRPTTTPSFDNSRCAVEWAGCVDTITPTAVWRVCRWTIMAVIR